MSRVSRILTATAALLLAVLYIMPLWSIRLVAPQYPEGLGMQIRLDTITGLKENDLRSINSLNHYIGMRPIEPSAIPELRYMPWVVAGLMVGGLAVALIGRRRLLAAWVLAFIGIGAAGMYDFWRWGYDYGHNLNADDAIIVVPGMTYQPPLIGTKQLLNFTATSWPAAGGVAAGLAMLLGTVALVMAYRRRIRIPAGSAVLAATMACAASGAALQFGSDLCAECHMVVADQRFGAELVTKTGKTITFDSVDCMKQYAARLAPGDISATWVVDANHPGTLIPESTARVIVDGELHPPMGRTYAVAR